MEEITIIPPVSEGGKPWVKNYGPNFPETIDYPENTLYEQVLERSKICPSYIAYDFMGNCADFASLMKQIDIIAAGLQEIGVKCEDVITICTPNTPHGLITFYAANKLGCIVNMIHPLSPSNEAKQYIEFSDSDWFVTIDGFLPKYIEMLKPSRVKKIISCSLSDYLPPITGIGFWLTKGRKIAKLNDPKIVTWKQLLALGTKTKIPTYARAISPDAPAVYLHSGGTTGSPKTIMLSSNNFNKLALNAPGILGVDPKDLTNLSMLCILPMFHGFGLCMSIHTMLVLGFKCILVPQYNAEEMAKNLIKKKPNFLAGVPTLFESIIRNPKLKNVDLSYVKAVFCGGDSLPPETKRTFDEFMKNHNSKAELLEGYGLTETVTVCTVNQVHASKIGTIGMPLSDILVKICEIGTCDEVPYGDDGEICVHGPTMMLGYLKDEQATNETIKTHADGKKWIHTGDVGCMDADGFIYYKQRLKRIIKCSGYPVFPSQVEAKIVEMPEVENCCVIGIPDDYQIERVKAFIVTAPGVAHDESLFDKIKQHCLADLAKWSVPTRWEFRDELPKTNVGKIDYITLTREESLKK